MNKKSLKWELKNLEKNGKTQNSILSIALCWTLPLHAYDIDELVKILIEKNENNSAFKYDDQIDDISLDNADKIFIPVKLLV